MVLRKGLILITFAWAIEVVAAVVGFVNAIVTTYPYGELPKDRWQWLWALPMGMIAVAELGRIPLTSVLFHRHLRIRLVALIGIIFLAGLAFENWMFGFERIVQVRLDRVTKAESTLADANAKLERITSERTDTNTSNAERRHELDNQKTDVEKQIKDDEDQRLAELRAIPQRCRYVRERGNGPGCTVTQQNQINQRYNRAIAPLRAQQAAYRNQINDLINNDHNNNNKVNVDDAKHEVNKAQSRLDNEKRDNQIYRFAAMWYSRGDATKVTPQEFDKARLFFTVFSALGVALAGTVAAFVYYARERVPGELWSSRLFGKFWRARRAYYARKRRPIYRDVPVEVEKEKIVYRDVPVQKIVYRDGKETVEVEKEVTRWIDRIVLIPRWFLKTPIDVNSLIREEKPGRTGGDGRVGEGEDGRVGDGDGRAGDGVGDGVGRVGNGEDGRVDDGR